jgi:UDP-N-acetylglucosamine diphosphorylase / glucose-1-phosphate thymidylyltransferase / UDP-N-acetylgalactosamine diphosphorylase / glucosamine-1-phosphate N-acetyltransferase / galactosamine-1-phosphate N-acetyltransferase
VSEPIVLVLAGGASNRFWPLRDKPLLPFASTTLLERHLNALRAEGAERFVVVSRPESEEAMSAIVVSLGLPESRVVVQPEPRGMADAFLHATPALDGMGDGPLYVTQAQDVVARDLHRAMLSGWARRGDGLFALLAASRVQEYFPGGYLSLEGDRITSVIEKPGAGKEPSDLVNLVAHCFASWKTLAQAVRLEAGREDNRDDAYERALASLMKERIFRPVIYEGRWQALKYPWHVLEVMNMLLDLWTSGSESPGVEYQQREDGVFLGPDVRIFPGAHVVAPAVIGPGAIIGHNALVRASIVGPNAVVGFGSEVARSYIGEGVELHHNYVGDSVMGAFSSMGFGATTANFRLDGKTVPALAGADRIDTKRAKLGLMLGEGAKIGVNTSTMPGVKIGAGALIGPGLNIWRDVPDGERVLDEERYGRV